MRWILYWMVSSSKMVCDHMEKKLLYSISGESTYGYEIGGAYVKGDFIYISDELEKTIRELSAEDKCIFDTDITAFMQPQFRTIKMYSKKSNEDSLARLKKSLDDMRDSFQDKAHIIYRAQKDMAYYTNYSHGEISVSKEALERIFNIENTFREKTPLKVYTIEGDGEYDSEDYKVLVFLKDE